MKKITLILFTLVACCWQSNSQIFIQENLDSGFPSGWTQNSYFASTTSSYLCEGTGNVADNMYGSASNDGTVTSSNYVSISNETDTNVSFEWLARPFSNNAIDYIIYVEYSTDDGANWNSISTFAVTTDTPCTNYSEVIAAASLPSGSDFKFQIRGEWQSGDSYFYLDNIVISQTISCPQPSLLGVSNTTPTSVDVAWTENGTATLWNIEVVDITSGDTVTGTATESGVTNPYTLSGLTADNDYEFYVQSDCDGSTSAWVGPLAFFTGYCIPASSSSLTYTDSFAVTGALANTATTETGYTGTGYADYYDSNTIESFEGGSFDFSATIVGGTAGYAIWVDWNNDLVFDASTETVFNTTSYGSGPFIASILVPSGTALGNYRLRTMVDYNDSNPNDDACALVSTRGEVEDFKITIVAAPLDTMDFNNVQWVTDGTNSGNTSVTVEGNTAVTVYAQGYEDGLTDPAGQAAGIQCWIAINNANTDPSTWDNSLWQVATYSSDQGNNDEYEFSTSTTAPGANYVASRWSLNNASFTYGGYNGTWDGTNNVSVELIVESISNDNFEDAEPIACGVVYNGSTAFATLDRDDAPDGVSADIDTQNVWYSYTGTVTGEEITLSTCSGSDYDTEGLIYTYDSVSDTFTFVAEGYDECGMSNGYTFETTFTSDGTSTYYISLAGFNGAAGNYEMSVACVLPCTADAGTLTADATPVVLSGGTATISATANGDSVVPTDYDVTYVLTSGSTLIIEDAGATPSFEVTTAGDYTIHTLVAETTDDTDSNYLDLSVIVFGTTTGGDVLDIINNNNLCAALDVTGAPIVVDEALNIDDLDKAAFTYFPNPVKNTLTLNAQNTIENVTMYNMLGQVVLKVTPNAISSDLDMSNLQTGTYFVQVMIANVTKTIRVIKQ